MDIHLDTYLQNYLIKDGFKINQIAIKHIEVHLHVKSLTVYNSDVQCWISSLQSSKFYFLFELLDSVYPIFKVYDGQKYWHVKMMINVCTVIVCDHLFDTYQMHSGVPFFLIQNIKISRFISQFFLSALLF